MIENLELKADVFRKLAEPRRPATILATNTSSISITALAARPSGPAQVIGMHFMNPVPVMKLVEVIRGHAHQRRDARRRPSTLTKKLGKTPVDVNDYPGFVSNRVLMPMINEAVFCLMEGVADERGHRPR